MALSSCFSIITKYAYRWVRVYVCESWAHSEIWFLYFLRLQLVIWKLLFFIFNALVLLNMDSTTSNFFWTKAFALEGTLAGQYLKFLGPRSSQKSLTSNFLSAPEITYKLESIHIVFTFVILHSSFPLDYFSCAWRTSIRGGLLVANSIFNEKYLFNLVREF